LHWLPLKWKTAFDWNETISRQHYKECGVHVVLEIVLSECVLIERPQISNFQKGLWFKMWCLIISMYIYDA
jgi:hypothetical protein